MTTAVVFRKYREADGGDVLALFPDVDEGRGLCSCYQHVGQHGAASYYGCVNDTVPAWPKEYADLMAELVSVGYDDLKVYTRRPPRPRKT